MRGQRTDLHRFRFAFCAVLAILPAVALADSNGVVSGNTTANGTANVPVITLPGTNLPGLAQQNLSSQQMQSIMMFRALQSRGSGRVRTGYPQFIPLGGPGFFPYAQQAVGAGDPQQQQVDDERQAKIERRIAARKAAEEKKRAARVAAKARNLAKAVEAKQAKAAQADRDADAAAPAADDK